VARTVKQTTQHPNGAATLLSCLSDGRFSVMPWAEDERQYREGSPP
jgi:hypothetical protein